MGYPVYTCDEYAVFVRRAWWQILWRVGCQIHGFQFSSKLPKELSGRVNYELAANKRLREDTSDRVHALAREAFVEPFREGAGMGADALDPVWGAMAKMGEDLRDLREKLSLEEDWDDDEEDEGR